ncbi:MAG TPA: pyridoxamine 5'-phosphate oxidase [Steroidobacteraceae bacterium]
MTDDLLPEALPESPMPLFTQWFSEAAVRRAQPNPDAMVLATVSADGKPSARVVLCKRIDASGYLVFFTNYTSRKGVELAARPRAAAVFHWDALHRQVRIEGPVVRSPETESDDYFATRPVASRVGAWASRQSQPLASRAALAAEVERYSREFGVDSSGQAHVPRPPHWGGYRLWIESVELWIEGAGRIHDRAVWSRELTVVDEFSYAGGAWRATRLNP